MSEHKGLSVTPCVYVEESEDGFIKLWFGSIGKPKQFVYISKDSVMNLRDFLNQFLDK